MYPTPHVRTDTSTTQGQRRPGTRRLAAALVWGALVIPLAGCTGTGPTAMPTITMPTIANPTIDISIHPPTLSRPSGERSSESKTTESKTTETKATSSPTSDSSGNRPSPWLWVILGIGVTVAVVAAIASARRRKDYVNALINDIISRGNWVVDHGTNAFMGAQDAAATQQTWSQLDGALVDLNADVTKLDGRVKGDQAQQVREVRDATSALRLAAETEARTRLSGPAPAAPSQNQAGAPTQSTDALFAARRRLASAIAVLDPNAPPKDSGTTSPTT